MAFKVIETQEAFDEALKERLSRERETIRKQYDEEYAPFKETAESLTKENAELKTTIEEANRSKGEVDEKLKKLESNLKNYEISSMKTKIALQNGIPYDMASRLMGEDEASITEDAKKLAELINAGKPTPPLKNTESNVDGENQSYISLLNNLNLEGE